jgi:hypothetical protein
MKAKEDWIKQTLGSVEDIQRAKPSSYFEEKLFENFTSAGKDKIILISQMTKWAAAASIVVLIGVNILSISEFNETSVTKTETNPVYTEYFSGFNTY